VEFHLLVFLAALLFAGPAVYRRARSAPDPEWAERWEALPEGERKRIAGAVRTGVAPQSQEEAELALALAYEQRKTVQLMTRPSLAHLVLAAVLLLELGSGEPLLVLSLTLVLLGYFIWVAYRDRITKRNLARAATRLELISS